MPKLTLALLSLLFIPTAAWCQLADRPPPLPTLTEMNTRIFLSINGGSSRPSARLTIYRTEDERLCTVLGIRRGPKALGAGYFKFTRLITVDGETREIAMKLKFPKKSSNKDKKLWIWQACQPSREPIAGSDKDLVRVTLRRPGFTPTKMWVAYPSKDQATGLNIRTASNSEFLWTPFTEAHPNAS